MTEFHQAMLVAGVWMIVAMVAHLRDDLPAIVIGGTASIAALCILLNQFV